jgi:hypothetical protein
LLRLEKDAREQALVLLQRKPQRLNEALHILPPRLMQDEGKKDGL